MKYAMIGELDSKDAGAFLVSLKTRNRDLSVFLNMLITHQSIRMIIHFSNLGFANPIFKLVMNL